MHAQMQEAHSMRQLELAKSTNIDKLVSATRYSITHSSPSLCESRSQGCDPFGQLPVPLDKGNEGSGDEIVPLFPLNRTFHFHDGVI